MDGLIEKKKMQKKTQNSSERHVEARQNIFPKRQKKRAFWSDSATRTIASENVTAKDPGSQRHGSGIAKRRK